MKFDKSCVYTALNADELKVGSKCFFADTIQDLRIKVQSEGVDGGVEELTGLYGDDSVARFRSFDCAYIYAYLIDLLKENKYRPFESVEEAMKAIKKHGDWIIQRDSGMQFIVFATDRKIIRTGDGWYNTKELFDFFIFADDGTPCGKLVDK